MQSKLDHLMKVSMKLGEALYSNTNNATAGDGNTTNTGSSSNSDESKVVDSDYQEIDKKDSK